MYNFYLCSLVSREGSGYMALDHARPVQVMGEEGVEPSHPCGYMALNHARLPVPPLARYLYGVISANLPRPKLCFTAGLHHRGI